MCLSTIPYVIVFQCHSVIIDQGISPPGNDKEMVNGINIVEKCYMYQLMSNVQLPVSRKFDSQILMYSCTTKNDVSLNK